MDVEIVLENGNKKKITLHNEDLDKYIVLTFAKNEDRYIVEFVEHYLKLGFDKIIIVDNNDKPTLENILSEFIKQGTVELLDFIGEKNVTLKIRQIYLYNGLYKWCGVFDCDEFLELNIHPDIKSFLSTIKEPCVFFNWLHFSANNQLYYEDKPLRERFTKPVSPIMYFKENAFVKSIVRGGDYWKNAHFYGTHLPFFNEEHKYKNIYSAGGVNRIHNSTHQFFPYEYKYGFIRHYYSKSKEEFNNKQKRGYSDFTNEDGLNESFNLFYPNTDFDIDRFIYTPYDSAYLDNLKMFDNVNNVLKTHNVILLTWHDEEFYSLLNKFAVLCKLYKDKTFILYRDVYEETTYTILLEIALHTNNRIIIVNDEIELELAKNKYY